MYYVLCQGTVGLQVNGQISAAILHGHWQLGISTASVPLHDEPLIFSLFIHNYFHVCLMLYLCL